MARALALVVFVIGALVSASLAQTLDTSFGTGGKVVLDATANGTFGAAVVVQPDRKFLVVGSTYAQASSTDSEVFVARYLPDGTPDTGFGSGGITLTNFAVGADDYANAVALAPDGTIYVAGSTDPAGTDVSDVLLLRYTSGGMPDGGFSGDGAATLDAGGIDTAWGVAVQPGDGKPVIAGGGGAGHDFVVARWATNGDPDNAFDGDGFTTTSFDAGLDNAYALLVQPDGNIVAGGVSNKSGGGGSYFALARYLPGGGPDPQFGNSGTKLLAGDANDSAFALALDADGKLLVAGEQLKMQSGSFTRLFEIARIDSSGTPDSSFGTGGFAVPQFTGANGTRTASANAILATTIGGEPRILVGGPASGDTTGDDFALLTLMPDGSPDPAHPVTLFDVNGVTDTLLGMALQPLTAAGRAHASAATADRPLIAAGSCDRTGGETEACVERIEFSVGGGVTTNPLTVPPPPPPSSEADVSIAKEITSGDGRARYGPGAYTLTIKNLGLRTVTVRVKDEFRHGFDMKNEERLAGDPPPALSCTRDLVKQVFTCTGQIPGSSTRIVTVDGFFTELGSHSNTATVEVLDATDPNPQNNTAHIEYTVENDWSLFAMGKAVHSGAGASSSRGGNALAGQAAACNKNAGCPKRALRSPCSVATPGCVSLLSCVPSRGRCGPVMSCVLGGSPCVPRDACEALGSLCTQSPRSVPTRAAGSAGALKVKRVEVAVLRLGKRSKAAKKPPCEWLASRSGRFKAIPAVAGKCRVPVWLKAAGTTSWRLKLAHKLPKGSYVAYSRATSSTGTAQDRFSAKDGNLRKFSVR